VNHDDEWNVQRKTFLETYAPLHLQNIIEKHKARLFSGRRNIIILH
jgi:hypothetical protein